MPEAPVDLPQDCVLEIHVEDALSANVTAPEAPAADAPPLAGLQELLADLPDDPDTPTDLAAQHDHYLHGMPKRP